MARQIAATANDSLRAPVLETAELRAARVRARREIGDLVAGLAGRGQAWNSRIFRCPWRGSTFRSVTSYC
jgi:hypothetical protein